MTSVDELVRRIVTVMNSNDPVARALTLRYTTLMCWQPRQSKISNFIIQNIYLRTMFIVYFCFKYDFWLLNDDF